MQFYLDGSPLWSPYTLNASSTNMASGIYIFLLLDNDNKGADWKNNPFLRAICQGLAVGAEQPLQSIDQQSAS